MYGLLRQGNIWPRYNCLKKNLESEGTKKEENIEKIAFKVVQIKSLSPLSNAYYKSKI